MEKEFAKWLLDIAKYVTTAVILSSIIGKIEGWWMYLFSASVVLTCLFWGLYLIHKKEKKEKED
ncbi:MAG: hypothetical protein LBG96_01230 [Tannerella sp.]|jgi:uncharacterized membrane protein YwaF|nr:hypothetical protein [Tannerella sp.]